MGARVYSIFFPLFFFLREKNGRINWKNSKEILSLFRSFFLSFFFLLILLPFSFWEGEWRGKRIEEFAPKHAKRNLQEQNGSRKSLIYQGLSALETDF